LDTLKNECAIHFGATDARRDAKRELFFLAISRLCAFVLIRFPLQTRRRLPARRTQERSRMGGTRNPRVAHEPSIDYVVTKIPRFAFEKFPQADPTLTTQMKSVGEAMAIGRTFKESLQKCLRSLEIGRSGLGGDGKPRQSAQ